LQAAFLVALDDDVFSGHVQLEQYPCTAPLELRRDRRPKAHDAGPPIVAAAPVGGDLDRLAHDPRVDALEQRAHLRLRVGGVEHRVDRRTRDRQPVQARVRACEPDQHDGEQDQRDQRHDRQQRALADEDACDDVGPGRLGQHGQQRAEVGQVALPHPHQRALLTRGDQRVDPQQVDQQQQAGAEGDERGETSQSRRSEDEDAQRRGEESRGPPFREAQGGGQDAVGERPPARAVAPDQRRDDVDGGRPVPALGDEHREQERPEKSDSVALGRRAQAAFEVRRRRPQDAERQRNREGAAEPDDVGRRERTDDARTPEHRQDHRRQERGRANESVHASSDD